MFKKSSKTKHISALIASRIVAHKRSGKNLVYLTESAGAFFLALGEIVHVHGRAEFKLIAERALTLEEAHDVLVNVFHIDAEVSAQAPVVTSVSASAATEILLLEIAKPVAAEYSEKISIGTIESPYFSTKDIFLSHQKTRGPNLN